MISFTALLNADLVSLVSIFEFLPKQGGRSLVLGWVLTIWKIEQAFLPLLIRISMLFLTIHSSVPVITSSPSLGGAFGPSDIPHGLALSCFQPCYASWTAVKLIQSVENCVDVFWIKQ